VDNSVDFPIRLPAAPLNPPLSSLCPKIRQFINALILMTESKVKRRFLEREKKPKHIRHETETFRGLCTTSGDKAGNARFCKDLRRNLKSMA